MVIVFTQSCVSSKSLFLLLSTGTDHLTRQEPLELGGMENGKLSFTPVPPGHLFYTL
jgi:hypothetical protein